MKSARFLRTTLELMRVHQWHKNVFVLAAPLFAKQLGEVDPLIQTLGAFASFCLMASAVYVLNDLVDVENDKLHPTKKNRPLASGRYSTDHARILIGVLVVAATVLAYLVSVATAAIILLYAVSNVLYSFVLKHMVILDIAFIGYGFILRILAGAFATGATPSFWIILCTLNVSLFLGFAKRRAELIALEEAANEHRKVLEHYSHDFLDQMISIVTTTTIMCYIMYTIDARTVEYFGTRGLVLTVPFVMYGVFRYLYISYHRNQGGSPTRAVLVDVPFIVNNALYAAACIFIVYFGENFGEWLD